jgi:hypothetical protein
LQGSLTTDTPFGFLWQCKVIQADPAERGTELPIPASASVIPWKEYVVDGTSVDVRFETNPDGSGYLVSIRPHFEKRRARHGLPQRPSRQVSIRAMQMAMHELPGLALSINIFKPAR